VFDSLVVDGDDAAAARSNDVAATALRFPRNMIDQDMGQLPQPLRDQYVSKYTPVKMGLSMWAGLSWTRLPRRVIPNAHFKDTRKAPGDAGGIAEGLGRARFMAGEPHAPFDCKSPSMRFEYSAKAVLPLPVRLQTVSGTLPLNFFSIST